MSPTAPPSVRPFFAEGIGQAAVLMPPGVALVVAGVALYWREVLRSTSRAALTLGAAEQAA